MSWLPTRERLLTHHFLQRFLENDLISPDADRHEVLSAVVAALIASVLFVTVLLCLKYLSGRDQPPGLIAVWALDDRFLYIACSMVIMGLVAVANWDALALDGRDTSILGPLPIPQAVIVRAKLTAIGLFATGFMVALNVVPSVLHPSLMAGNLPVGVIGVIRLIAVHAAVTMSAGAFGFLVVFGLRQLLQAFLDTAVLSRVSAVVQAGLVLVLATAFMLLPGRSSNIAQSWLLSDAVTPYTIPPLWFLGLQETLVGDVIDQLPRDDLPTFVLDAENEATALYQSLQPLLRTLGGIAMVALGLAVLVAVAIYVLNSRRLPTPPAARPLRRRRVRALLGRTIVRFVVRHPVAQAGFFFTAQCLWRSVPHRLTMAAAVAVGLATSTVALRSAGAREAIDMSSLPVALLAVQTVLIITVLVGFRHAVRVPAELRANWTFKLSWLGDERSYLSGVKRAALTGSVVPTLLVLLPLHASVFGSRLASVHLVYGFLVALAVLDVLLLGYRKLPFATSYVPTVSLKTLGPLYMLAFLLTVYGLAWVERVALNTTWGAVVLFSAIVAVIATIHAVDRWQRRTRVAMDLDEGPAPAIQRLGLGG